jgi:hypothetical protein
VVVGKLAGAGLGISTYFFPRAREPHRKTPRVYLRHADLISYCAREWGEPIAGPAQ